MPIIRQIGLGNVSEDVQRQPTYTAEQFGASNYRAIGQVGESIGALASTIAKNQKEIDELAAEDARNKAAIELNDETNRIMREYSGNRISERRSALDEAHAKLEEKYSSNLGGQARTLFSKQFSSLKTNNTMQVADRTVADLQKYEDDVFESTINTIKSEFVSGQESIGVNVEGGTVSTPNNGIRRANTRILEYGMKRGWSEEQIANKILEVESGFHEERAAYLSSSSAIAAKEYIESNKANMAPSSYTAALSKVSAAADDEQATIEANTFIDKNAIQAPEKIRSLASASLSSAAADKVYKILDKQKAVQDKAGGAAIATAISTAIETGNVPVFSSVVPTNAQRLVATIAKMPKEAVALDSSKYNSIVNLIGSDGWQNAPEAILNAKDSISQSQAIQLGNLYAKRYAGSDVYADLQAEGAKERVGSIVAKISGKKKDTPEYQMVERVVLDAIAKEESVSKRKLSDDEKVKVAAKQALQWRDGNITTPDKKTFEADSEYLKKAKITKSSLKTYAQRVGLYSGSQDLNNKSLSDIALKLTPEADAKFISSLPEQELLDYISFQIKYGNTGIIQ